MAREYYSEPIPSVARLTGCNASVLSDGLKFQGWGGIGHPRKSKAEYTTTYTYTGVALDPNSGTGDWMGRGLSSGHCFDECMIKCFQKIKPMALKSTSILIALV